ncbi:MULTISPECIES: bifunctional diguanylate cyclase/phosphodiesterase [unclassified Shewanella]|uniref:putative bifunctional diguanylate cyclase/phosphodiesterase n=1 Tax=unclassified Shewanella TaxID=196818 RepID=UPI001BBDB710|nr:MULTISPECIES: EAL domain-containing protein [unclassified Shewanella]GIU16515.1 cyclic di-GMP phosphodiesterase PdeB [Shewanella sp. MBTL60-112-B1]GIU36914.1 cyclic di-GMP phosphodiesterase PdeB [Shewanella sp. MBTL60-112-B2]
MQIGKKVVLVIFGICIPLLALACLAGVTWLHSEVDAIRSYVIEKELESIQSQVDRDIERFQLQLDNFSINYQIGNPTDLLPEDALFSSTHMLQIKGGKLEPLDMQQPMDSQLPMTLLASEQAKAGVYFDKVPALAYLISIQAKSADSERLVSMSRLTDDYLATLGFVDFATRITIAAGSAKPGLVLTANTVTAQLALPALVNQEPVHLSIAFSNQFFSRMAWQYSLLTLGGLGLVIALQLVVFIWLRNAVFRPLNRLSEQVGGIGLDLKGRAYINGAGIHGTGKNEFGQVTKSINHLLENLYRQESQSQVTLESIAEAVILTDNNAEVSYINPYAERLLKQSTAEALGKRIHELLPDNQSLSEKVTAFLQSVPLNVEPILLRLNCDTPKLMSGTLTHLSNHSGEIIGAVLVLKDTTQEALLKRKLQRQTYLDPVTGLLNRATFEERFIEYAQSSQSLAVVYLDLEQFKLINDSSGHTVGDKMLNKVAKSIESCLSDNMLLGRIGGDEFGLIIKDSSALAVAKLIKKIIAGVGRQTVTHNDTCYRVGVSVGVALSRFNKDTDLLGLLKDADIACLAAKSKGSNQVYFYDGRDIDLSYQRNAPKWAVRIVQAIEHNELILYYQKIKCLSSHSHRQRLEVLLRIQEPGGRVLPPAQFIAAAERFKLIVDVDKEVIRKTFLWLSLNEALWDDHCLSINLSGNSLGAEGMVDFILSQQKRFSVPSSCICFEITETSAIQNRSRAMKMLLDLRKRGFAFALDDFGSGFASYGYLKEMPVDYVKIDGCFVKNLASNAKDYAIVKSVNDVCRVMGIETVAEFVENQEIIDKLEVIGVNYAQGYGIGRPQPLDAYQKLSTPEKLMA